MARKGLYAEWLTDDGLLLIEGWARDGLTDEQIAAKIGITAKTLYEWQNRFSEIREAIKKGKAPVDVEVENALLKSALGYYVTIKEPIKVKTEKQKVGEGKIVEEHIEYVEKQIYIPPQNTAQIFWLKNRKPDKWKDKREQVVATKDGMLADLISGLKEPQEE